MRRSLQHGLTCSVTGSRALGLSSVPLKGCPKGFQASGGAVWAEGLTGIQFEVVYEAGSLPTAPEWQKPVVRSTAGHYALALEERSRAGWHELRA